MFMESIGISNNLFHFRELKENEVVTLDQTVDDPGSCHWHYTAYWEIDGMSGTSISCNYEAWDNPGCNYQRKF